MKPSCKSGTRLYEIWRGMKRRCECENSKDWPQYGGRGIKICDEWSKSLTAFIDWAWDNGYTVDRSLDRVNVNDGYSPENCRWAHYLEQQLNKQDTGKVYTNIRFRADRMRVLLAMIPDDSVVTIIARRDLFTEQMNNYFDTHWDKDSPIPEGERKDKTINKGVSRTRKTAPKFMDDFEASFSGDF